MELGESETPEEDYFGMIKGGVISEKIFGGALEQDSVKAIEAIKALYTRLPNNREIITHFGEVIRTLNLEESVGY